MKATTWLVCTTLLAGCAGVSIDPISPTKSGAAHTDNGSVSGYLVYGPMIVMQIGESEVCTQRANDGKCTANKTLCTVGAPTALPDYSKPFAVNIRSGFGKAGVEVQIADGWRLSGVKDASDNTALLSFIEKNVLKTESIARAKPDKPCGALEPGLYQWTPGSTNALTRLNIGL